MMVLARLGCFCCAHLGVDSGQDTTWLPLLGLTPAKPITSPPSQSRVFFYSDADSSLSDDDLKELDELLSTTRRASVCRLFLAAAFSSLRAAEERALSSSDCGSLAGAGHALF